MSPETIFTIHLVLGYVACLLCFGLVFILPGVVRPNLPASFATFAAYGDFATGVLALLALLAIRIHRLFWTLAVVFNVVGIVDLVLDYYLPVRVVLPAMAGELGSTYVIPVIYVPALMITHIAAFYLLLRYRPKAAMAGAVVAS